MVETFYRDSWIEVNLKHIAENIKQLKMRLNERTGIYAVVKANGYGHGDVQVAKAAIHAGATRLAVALMDEAIRLREAGIREPILVMGWIRPEHAQIAIDYDITVTCFQKEWIEAVKKIQLSNRLKVHLKWDTGMGRIGLTDEEELKALLALLDEETFQVEGVFTHFATADEKDLAYYNEQNNKFKQLLKQYSDERKTPFVIHTGNSAASMRFPDDMYDFVRYGISMYGLYPSPDVLEERPIELKPALSLYSRLVHVKKVEAGSFISYGATYQAKEDEWIGTVPLGYADGIKRSLQGADVLVQGQRCEIVGRICMDQLMVRLPREMKVGEKVTLIGKQYNEEITMDELAEHLDTINYEIACMLSYRVPRVYKGLEL
ncbi:alanine racemase [Saliterribacillus persicus]|uniref:Alanine racemase n=1 Tax=Saliterribacillus persicus TaxID=930114 RepID=A0A368XYF4_9BACI|nr:alanine racemase [Saliterribacillus persicus]RCW73031.1 alanine racemase [Saliterribacillus persicus]